MKKLLLLCSFLISLSAFARPDSSHLRVSLLTCGTGPESWQTFGHTAIRIIDSSRGTDMAYNYGTFAFDDDFVTKFMRGKLLYYLSYYPYEAFLDEYVDEKRSVYEQELLLPGDKKLALQEFLHDNAKEENRYYKYDFFFDNCATRIRDIFPKSLGASFQYGETPAATERISFRDIINQYYYAKHWERIGVNVLLGSRIDAVMTNKDMMFLPDFLSDGIGKANVNGKPIAGEKKQILDGSPHLPAGLNGPFVVMLGICILTLAGLMVRQLKPLGSIMTFLVLFISGILGCLMLVMWFATDHQGCDNNLNILWALPTNLLIAFTGKKGKGRYAVVGIACILIALLLHVLRVQALPLVELWPMLLALVFIFGTIYKRDKA
jgi:hypothetical protein